MLGTWWFLRVPCLGAQLIVPPVASRRDRTVGADHLVVRPAARKASGSSGDPDHPLEAEGG